MPPFPPQIGQFPAADLTQLVRLIDSEIEQLASVSRVPYQELLQANSSIPSSGEAQKAAEAAVIRKAMRMQLSIGDGWEEVMRVALRAVADERADLRTAETIWVSPETRNEAVRTDSVVKQRQVGLIDEQTGLEELGYSPAQIRRIMSRDRTPAGGATSTPAPAGPQMSPTEGQ